MPVVTANINGRPARLILDTGSDVTVLNRAAASRLGIAYDERTTVPLGGAGGQGRAFSALLPSLGLGGATTGSVRAIVTNVPLPPLDGVVGINVLVGYEMDIDLPHRRLALYRARPCPAALPPWTAPYTRLPVQQQRSGHLYVSAALDGQPIFALLDTGATLTTVAPGPARDAGVTDAALRRAPTFRSQAFNEGGLGGRVQRFASLTIGADTVTNPALHVADLPPYAGEAIIGEDYLGTRRLWVSMLLGTVFATTNDQPGGQPRPR